MVAIRNQVGRKQIHAYWRIRLSAIRLVVMASAGNQLEVLAKMLTEVGTIKPTQQHACSGESWQKPLRERTSTSFLMKTETLVFADIPDYPAVLKDLLTGFWRTVTLLVPSF